MHCGTAGGLAGRRPTRRPAARAADPGTAALLFGHHDMDVAQGDRLTLNGAVYEVVFIHPERDVETVCNLEARQ